MKQEIFNWVWILLLFVMIVVRKYYEKKAGRPASLKGTPVLEYILMILWGLAAGVIPLIYIFSELLAFADYPFKMYWIFKLTGILVFISSISLLTRSHMDLDKMWSITVEPKYKNQLVTKGVYKRMRHPMYTAHLLWGIAQLMFFPNYVAGPSAVIIFYAIMLLRIPREEKALMKEYGDKYRRYILQTGRIFPRFNH